MPYVTPASFDSQTASMEGAWPIQMFAINASPTGSDYLYYAAHNGDIFGYELDSTGAVINTATLYTGFPIEHGDIKSNIEGEIPSVDITVPNTDRTVESLIQEKNYLRGMDVHLMTFFAKNLPTGTSNKHLGTIQDYKNCLKEKLYIDTVTSNEKAVNFSCKPKFELHNVTLPRRRYSKECAWAENGRYLATECDPTDRLTDAGVYITCGGTLASCRERVNSSHYGGYPSIPDAI